MSTPFLENPRIQKPLRFFFAYLLFALFALLGLLLVVNVHTTVINLCIFFNARYQIIRFFYVWGAFIFFAVYAILIALLESTMNNAAKSGKVLAAGLKVFAFEAVLALATEVIPMLLY